MFLDKGPGWVNWLMYSPLDRNVITRDTLTLLLSAADPGSYDGNVAAMAGPLVCYNCGETGHYTMDWSKPPKPCQRQYVRPGGELGEDAGTRT